MNGKNLTIRDISRISNVSEPTVSRMMSGGGQNVSIATLEAVCTALNVDVYTGSFEIKEEQPSGMEAVYLARIEDLKSTIAAKDKWIRALFIVCVGLVGFLLTVLAVDLLNPAIGWIRA